MTEKRRYSSALRTEQTAIARTRILAAAGTLFVERGYLGTTLAAIAKEAGVSVQTVYNVIGGKPALLKTVHDVTLAGDDEPIAMMDRPEYQAILAATDARECIAGYARMARLIGERTMTLLRMAHAQAATGDPELTEHIRTVDAQLEIGSGMMAQHVAGKFGLREGLDVEAATDILWSLNSSDLAYRLVITREWGWDRYEQWHGRTMADLLLGPA